MAERVVLSTEGFAKLTAELEHLKSHERQRSAENIREAKSHGDLRENAMYHEAKLNQKRMESRIAELEKVLQIAQVVQPSSGRGEVGLGSRVRVLNLGYGDEMIMELVGAFEADPLNDKISIASPLGQALMGCTVHAEVEVVTPGGTQRYRVLFVE